MLSYIEQQALLTGLIETFQFNIPDGGLDVRRVIVGPLMIPLLRDDPEKGAQMPLKVSLVGA
jgi:hypothetical protein